MLWIFYEPYSSKGRILDYSSRIAKPKKKFLVDWKGKTFFRTFWVDQLFKLFTFIVNLMKKLLDQLNLSYGVGVRAGEERGTKPFPPLSLFVSSSPVFPSTSSIPNINRKGQSASYTFSLLQQLDLFKLCIFEKKKWDSGKRWKKCGCEISSPSNTTIQPPLPFQTMKPWTMLTNFNWVFVYSTLRPSHTWTKEMSDDV